VIFLARAAGTVIDSVRRPERAALGRGVFYFITVIVLQILFGVLATLILMALSRRRAYRAHAGGAHLAGAQSMIGLRAPRRAGRGEPLPGERAKGLGDSRRQHARRAQPIIPRPAAARGSYRGAGNDRMTK
jgi:heat shock protein HtpX